MQIHQIIRIHKNKKNAAVGRGGTRGKTSGRGTKGQNARAGHKNRPEFREIIKKLPKLRGRGRNSNLSIQEKPAIVSIAALEKHFENGDVIDRQTLLSKGLIELRRGFMPPVKILGNVAGTTAPTKKFSFRGVSLSKSTRDTMEIKKK